MDDPLSRREAVQLALLWGPILLGAVVAFVTTNIIFFGLGTAVALAFFIVGQLRD